MQQPLFLARKTVQHVFVDPPLQNKCLPWSGATKLIGTCWWTWRTTIGRTALKSGWHLRNKKKGFLTQVRYAISTSTAHRPRLGYSRLHSSAWAASFAHNYFRNGLELKTLALSHQFLITPTLQRIGLGGAIRCNWSGVRTPRMDYLLTSRVESPRETCHPWWNHERRAVRPCDIVDRIEVVG